MTDEERGREWIKRNGSVYRGEPVVFTSKADKIGALLRRIDEMQAVVDAAVDIPWMQVGDVPGPAFEALSRLAQAVAEYQRATR